MRTDIAPLINAIVEGQGGGSAVDPACRKLTSSS
jgi:hypothetical protein